jgi:hypothetical protein
MTPLLVERGWNRYAGSDLWTQVKKRGRPGCGGAGRAGPGREGVPRPARGDLGSFGEAEALAMVADLHEVALLDLLLATEGRGSVVKALFDRKAAPGQGARPATPRSSPTPEPGEEATHP